MRRKSTKKGGRTKKETGEKGSDRQTEKERKRGRER